MKGITTSFLTGLLLLLFCLTALAQDEELPREFVRVLPRGQLASIDAPQFVSAGEAEISKDAWVFGVVVAGQAKAYSLNLLNHHEVVNDKTENQAFAAVW